MKALVYAKRLIGFESVSEQSNRIVCKYLEFKLHRLGFVVEKLEYRDANGIRKFNLIGKLGEGQGGLAYFGHTDTVPAKSWRGSGGGPFEAHVSQGLLYGRGACDMKGSLACALAAARKFSDAEISRPLYLCFTADEEIGYHGIKQVVNESKIYREMVAGQVAAIVGEPTELQVVTAHKATCLITAVARGHAAHSSTREGSNANWKLIPFLAEAKQIREETETDPRWQSELFDPPTVSMNIVIADENQAINITSPQATCSIYLRPMKGISVDPIVARLQKVAQANDLEFAYEVRGEPFHVAPNSELVHSGLKLTGTERPQTVCYGTDGGFLTELDNKIVLGPGSIDQAHTDHEFIAIDQLRKGTDVYSRFIQRYCC